MARRATAKRADPTVEQQLRRMTDITLTCRSVRHAWDIVRDVNITIFNRRVESFVRRLVCLRCGSTRLQHWQRDTVGRLRVFKTTPGYADGYLLKNAGRRLRAVEVVTEQLRRKGYRA